MRFIRCACYIYALLLICAVQLSKVNVIGNSELFDNCLTTIYQKFMRMHFKQTIKLTGSKFRCPSKLENEKMKQTNPGAMSFILCFGVGDCKLLLLCADL